MVAFGGLVYGLWLDTRLARCLEIVFGVGGGAGLVSERGVLLCCLQARWQGIDRERFRSQAYIGRELEESRP